MELRNALRTLRSEAGLTQTEFASALFVSFSTVSRWENRGMRPNRMQSKTILDLAKHRRVSAGCLEWLSQCLLASRADDKEDKLRMKQAEEQVKAEQRNSLTAEQFRKTMDNIDMAIIGQRFYDRDPANCDIFYYNTFFAESFGYPLKDFDEKLHKKPFFAIAPEFHRELMQSFRALLSHSMEVHEFSQTVKAIRRDGSTFWMEIKAASLTEYSYGQEVFTSCRDVTPRVNAEQRYKEEVLLRDVSMQVMFSNIHCDLTENRVSRHYNLPSVLGREYSGETLDQLIRIIADAAPDGAEKAAFPETFSREALLRSYSQGKAFGSMALYNQNARRWFRIEYLLVRNPANSNILALIYFFDIQKQVISESMLGIFFRKFFDFVGLIDPQAKTVTPYFYADGVFREQYPGQLHDYPTVCAEKLRQYGYSQTREKESRALDLRTVLDRLGKSEFYVTLLHLRGYDGKTLRKKITFSYLDETKNTIIIAQSDVNTLRSFLPEQKKKTGKDRTDE